MTKKYYIFAIVATLLVVFSGCGSVEEKNEEQGVKEQTVKEQTVKEQTVAEQSDSATSEVEKTVEYELSKEDIEENNKEEVEIVDPQFVISTTDIDGNPVKNEDFASAKLIMVNFWEPWCGPCVGEMPDLERLYEEYKSDGLVILGVFSTTDMVEEARDVIKSCGTTYPILIYDDIMEPYTTDYVPTTVFVAANGDVLTDEPFIGGDSYEGWKEIIEEYMNR